MDDLIAYGTAGILFLFVASVLVLYGFVVLVITAGRALASGDFPFLTLIIAVIVVAFSCYTATGIWLQRTNRI